jgi:hypothetical protein
MGRSSQDFTAPSNDYGTTSAPQIPGAEPDDLRGWVALGLTIVMDAESALYG